jgi:hypothetical protein
VVFVSAPGGQGHREEPGRAVSAFEHACHIEALGAEIQIERQKYADFLDALTRKLNDAGVPAMSSWPSAIEYMIRERDEARFEIARLREQIAWTVARCNATIGDGNEGTPNSAVAAVCDELERLRDESVSLDAVVEALRERGELACGGFEKEAAEFLLQEFRDGNRG